MAEWAGDRRVADAMGALRDFQREATEQLRPAAASAHGTAPEDMPAVALPTGRDPARSAALTVLALPADTADVSALLRELSSLGDERSTI